VFQYKNHFPERGIYKPNLVVSKYFRSAKNSPENSLDEYDNDFDIECILDPKKKKLKTKTFVDRLDSNVNPYDDKMNLKKKKTKPGLDNSDAYMKASQQKDKKQQRDMVRQKEYFEKMLGEELTDEDRLEESKFNNIQRTETDKLLLETQEKMNKSIVVHVDGINIEGDTTKCHLCNNNYLKDSKPTLKKKENPCLMDPNTLK
jgi:hypothetical protein